MSSHREGEERMIKGIKIVSVPVTDQQRAVEFYTEKLGFVVSTDQPYNNKQRWIELRIPGSDTRLVPFMMDGFEDRVGKFQNFTFYADNVEKTAQELMARGVEFVQQPKTESWGTSSIFKDSEGNQFVLGSK
jgi:predicted enzyme related to lactoylglutathione lyase